MMGDLIDGEAVDSDEDTGIDTFERLFDDSECISNVSSLIDDTGIDEPDNFSHSAVLNILETQETLKTVEEFQELLTKKKRKTIEDNSVIPLKKALEHNVPQLTSESPADQASTSTLPSQVSESDSDKFLQLCLKSKHARIEHLTLFKKLHTASYTELTRNYKSNKTQNTTWVIAVFYLAEAGKEMLINYFKSQCINLLYEYVSGISLVLYCEFSVSKNRDTIKKALDSLNFTNVELIDPPNIRSVLAALFWKRCYVVKGDYPPWMVQITSMDNLNGEQFELSKMIQWAYDNHYVDEGTISFEYAKLADECVNAALWLKSNSQAKYVRDCATMVKNYLRGKMNSMSISEFISSRCVDTEDEDDRGYKKVVKLLGFQGINYYEFLSRFRDCLHAKPKKCALAFIGVPDSGKSMFCMTLIKFLKGRVLSFSNSKSHFWLQPLSECKIALIDDATITCWYYIDTYLRAALDGNPISLDIKHKTPIQIRCPPLLITSNTNIKTEKEINELKFKYLLNRITIFEFQKQIPIRQGVPVFEIVDTDWKSFFKHFWTNLDLDPDWHPDNVNPTGETGENTGGESENI